MYDGLYSVCLKDFGSQPALEPGISKKLLAVNAIL
jgi:hypothetical protein